MRGVASYHGETNPKIDWRFFQWASRWVLQQLTLGAVTTLSGRLCQHWVLWPHYQGGCASTGCCDHIIRAAVPTLGAVTTLSGQLCQHWVLWPHYQGSCASLPQLSQRKRMTSVLFWPGLWRFSCRYPVSESVLLLWTGVLDLVNATDVCKFQWDHSFGVPG